MRLMAVALVLAISALTSEGSADDLWSDGRVDLELMLLADASRSIDDGEIRFQRQIKTEVGSRGPRHAQPAEAPAQAWCRRDRLPDGPIVVERSEL